MEARNDRDVHRTRDISDHNRDLVRGEQMKIIDGHDVIEHAEVNGEDRAFIRKLTDYIEDADVVEPKRGEWIVHFDDLFPEESTEECSVCHAEQTLNGNDDNFCPNCGADMKGADDEER